MEILAVTRNDYDAVWEIFRAIVSRGDTYAFDPATGREEALDLWVHKPAATYVCRLDGVVAGTYYLKPNQPALGAHVCNCGYMVPAWARGRGIATAMCRHSQVEAVRLGFKAMQFNLVVATNEVAIRLWQRLGYDIVGTLPRAFNHRTLGLVDAHVMYKWLDAAS
jgi:RimJ/RimL family protein N-acetyltransferase